MATMTREVGTARRRPRPFVDLREFLEAAEGHRQLKRIDGADWNKSVP